MLHGNYKDEYQTFRQMRFLEIEYFPLGDTDIDMFRSSLNSLYLTYGK
jgi:hypothetical protein